MRAAEEMPARTDFLHRFETGLVEIDLEWLQHAAHVLQHFAIDDQLFERRDQAALEPARGVINQIAIAHHRAP